MTEPSPRPAAPFGDDPLEEHVVESQLIHRGRYLEFRTDTIERADGSRGTRDVVGHPGAVAVLALDDDGRLLLVRQWRSPAGRAMLEIPAGTLDVHDGLTEDPDEAARRELEEETGHRATTWRKLATFWTAPGFASELMHLYLATGISGADGDERLTPDEDERLELRHVPIEEALGLVDRGEICDAKSILGIQWLDRLRHEAEPAGLAAGTPSVPPPVSGAATGPADVVSIEYGYTILEFALANAALLRRQRGSLVMGGLFALLAVFNLLTFQDLLLAAVAAFFAASFLTGLLVVPFAWFSFRNKGHLFARIAMTIDGEAVTSTWPIGGGSVRWTGIEKIDGDRRWLFMKSAGGATQPVPRRAFSPEKLRRFELLALAHGLTLNGHRVDPPGR